MTSSSPVTSSVGTLMVFNVSMESGREAMPRCTCATSSGDILRIMRSAPSTKSGRISRVFFAGEVEGVEPGGVAGGAGDRIDHRTGGGEVAEHGRQGVRHLVAGDDALQVVLG